MIFENKTKMSGFMYHQTPDISSSKNPQNCLPQMVPFWWQMRNSQIVHKKILHHALYT